MEWRKRVGVVNGKEVYICMKGSEVTGIDIWKISKEEVIPLLKMLDPSLEWFFEYCAKTRHLDFTWWGDVSVDVSRILDVIRNCNEKYWREKKVEELVKLGFNGWLTSLKEDGWFVLGTNDEVYMSKKIGRKSVKLSIVNEIVTWLRIGKVSWSEALWIVREYAPAFDSEFFSLLWGELKFAVGVRYDCFPLEELVRDLLLIDVWG